MARTPLYSRSPQSAAPVPPTAPLLEPKPAGAPAADVPPAPRWGHRLRRHERLLWALAVVAGLLIAGWPAWTAQVKRPLSFEQIDAAVRESIAKEPLAAAAAAAYEAILPSVVQVIGEPAAPPVGSAEAAARKRKLPPGHPATEDDDPMAGRSVGTGVVIVDKGLILTNLHVVAGAARILVNFADGSQSEAKVV
ncbi:MAG: serine protease, partial [Microbacteriaceae bacterium]|nr:serine protease [Burkholderiaceae bacterium]